MTEPPPPPPGHPLPPPRPPAHDPVGTGLPYDAYPAPAAGPYEQPGHTPIAVDPYATGSSGYDTPSVDHGYDRPFQGAPYEPAPYEPAPVEGAPYEGAPYEPASFDPTPFHGHPVADPVGDPARPDDHDAVAAAAWVSAEPDGTTLRARPEVAAGAVRPVGPQTPRWATLSYTSFDRPGERGGWQVKQRHGGLDEAETQLLQDAVQTHLDDGTELPDFPTPEQIAAMPRRLCHLPLGPGAAASWHTAPAGTDATGRPGNVFAHLLLDRDRLADGSGLRPIDRWRSTGWVTPYGADQVRAAEIEPDPPAAGTMITRESVAAFLTDPQAWRLGVFSVLVDACAAALAGGPPVVLVCGDHDRAAQWIGAVSHVLSPVWAAGLGFSTLERIDGLPAAFARGVQLACVPTLDAERLRREPVGAVVISEDEAVQLGDRGGEPHRTAHGDAVAVTPWSGLVQAVLTDPETATTVLTRADAIAARVHDPDDPLAADPLAPLALVVARNPERHPDGTDEAAEILTARAPATLAGSPDLAAAAEQVVVTELPEGTAAAHRAWQQAREAGRGDRAPVVGAVYRRRAAADLDWLLTEAARTTPGPFGLGLDESLTTTIGTAAAEITRRAGADPVRAALAGLGLVTVTGDAAAADGGVGPTLRRLVAETVLRPVAGGRTEIIDRAGELTPRTAAVVADVLAADPSWARGPVGRRLPREVLRWVFPDGVDPDLPDPDLPDPDIDGPDAAAAGFDPGLRLRGEVAAQLWRQVPELAPLAVWATLSEPGGTAEGPAGHGFAEIADLLAHPWPIPVLGDLQRRLGDRLPPHAWLATITGSPDSDDLVQVCRWLARPDDVAGRTVGPRAGWQAVAAARLLEPRWSERPDLGGTIELIVDAAVAGRQVPATPFAPRLAEDVQLAVVLVVIEPSLTAGWSDPGRIEELRPWFADQRLRLADRVVDAAAARLADRGDVLALIRRLARTDPAIGVPGAGGDRIDWLARVRTEGSSHRGARVLRACIRAVLGRPGAPDRAAVATAVTEELDPGRAGGRARSEELQAWVTDLVGVAEPRRRGLFGGTG